MTFLGARLLAFAGVVYLVRLGVRTWRAAGRHPEGLPAGAAAAPGALTSSRGYVAGLTTNLLNPKVGLFYATLLPQFVPDGAPVLPVGLAFALVHVVESIVWLTVVAALVDRTRSVVGRPAVSRRLEQLTGVVLIGLGARLALERR
jgi:threonine/homoserine/homoserine lactone efflux protein